MDTNELSKVSLPPANPPAALAHAQHKRLHWAWNDWGQHMVYADLITSGAACIDSWADPAFLCPHTGAVGLWLRAEVWLHPDGTTYRTILNAHSTVVVPPLECCPRPHELPEDILLPLSLVPPALRARTEVMP